MEERQAFGKYLQGERALRQIPLAEVAAATKIPIRTLEQLETGEWGDLPAGVFVRGFVRSFARHVGVSAEDACGRYDEVVRRLDHARALAAIEPVGETAADVGGRRRFGLALVVIILLILATITLSLLWRRGASADTHASVEAAVEALRRA